MKKLTKPEIKAVERIVELGKLAVNDGLCFGLTAKSVRLLEKMLEIIKERMEQMSGSEAKGDN